MRASGCARTHAMHKIPQPTCKPKTKRPMQHRRCRYILCVYACMYVYIYIYKNIYVYMCVYVRICVYMCVYMCVYVCICVCTYSYMYVCMYILCVCTGACVCERKRERERERYQISPKSPERIIFNEMTNCICFGPKPSPPPPVLNKAITKKHMLHKMLECIF